MSEENKSETGEKLESSVDHAKKALGAAAEAGKAVGETVKKHAQAAYESGKDHLSAAAKDVSEVASSKYQELRGQAADAAGVYREKAEAAWSDANARVQDFQGEAEHYIRENPLRAIGIAVGVGFVLGVIFRR